MVQYVYMRDEGTQAIASRGVVGGDPFFAAGVASDLMSPLVVLRQLGVSLSDDTISTADKEIIGRRVALTTERAMRLVGSLTSVTESQLELPLETINPMSVCSEVVHELTPLFMEYGQSIKLDHRINAPLSIANRSVLKQILLGLGDNALYYGSMDRPVGISVRYEHGKIRIGVRDYGPGVSINIWDEIEDMVRRHAASPLASRPRSSATILIAVRRLAELMGSRVGVLRHKDGATFYIDLHVSSQLSLV